eukprot:TRINITY_DN74086_c0_g1_i1.p1 TRINITY_DN74086_c0_g1~~TRINITY_DN74086_c0_g1_i1.p1  ORF type:complete len:520 (+),score=132.45 TRINITY_DN74086_c0_g1_i1:140-1699(+)
MDTPGNDGASEGSYESVASEGGFEPASERGRDQLPRIISASHCVEVFRRMRCIDGAHCIPSALEEDAELERKAAAYAASCGSDDRTALQLPRPHDQVLAGFPRRLLRFDGAIEAWLEELPPCRVDGPSRMRRHYTQLNDAAQRPELKILSAGNRRATLWYFTLEFLQQIWPQFLRPDNAGLMMWERALLERNCTIKSTHVDIGRVHCPHTGGKALAAWMKALFAAMQVTEWSPAGEARQFLAHRRASHASMSIGDCIQVGNDLFVVTVHGFLHSKASHLLLGDHELDENEDPLTSYGRKDEAGLDDVISCEEGSVEESGDEASAEEDVVTNGVSVNRNMNGVGNAAEKKKQQQQRQEAPATREEEPAEPGGGQGGGNGGKKNKRRKKKKGGGSPGAGGEAPPAEGGGKGQGRGSKGQAQNPSQNQGQDQSQGSGQNQGKARENGKGGGKGKENGKGASKGGGKGKKGKGGNKEGNATNGASGGGDEDSNSKWVVKGDRADRRALRKKLQEERERHQQRQ